ncbi:MAG: DUF4450 domain-containing protein [Chitinophagaceae bacterium]
MLSKKRITLLQQYTLKITMMIVCRQTIKRDKMPFLLRAVYMIAPAHPSLVISITGRRVARLLFLSCALLAVNFAGAQPASLPWHGIERELRYRPEGNDIVIENGSKRFNRALYGGNTAFRAEAGDLPEFALYMPGMGGNLQFGIIAGGQSKWLIHAQSIKAIYRPGSMVYEIRDSLLKNGTVYLTAMALYNSEALVVRLNAGDLPAGVQLVAVYGGATGKKFSRDGDIGADPESSFYLKPEYCTGTIYRTDQQTFTVLYGLAGALTEEERYEIQYLPDANKNNKRIGDAKKITGVFPPGMKMSIADAHALASPASLLRSPTDSTPVIAASQVLGKDNQLFFYIGRQVKDETITYASLSRLFDEAEGQRKALAARIRIRTPDPYINTLGGVLGIAADAIWESPSFLHGAVAWRMRLNGWRGAYAGDVLGWHDRSREHFDGYAASQLTAPPVTGVVMDTALHLARHQEKTGTALFSKGYIARNPYDTGRAHHYDMNLVLIDQLLNHFNYTGDTAYVRTMWPVLARHLAWEKRNFDADGDGLYDAYAAIWASDALQYSGGGVTHSSAYNYRANKAAAQLARLIAEDAAPYETEAAHILSAVNEQLWLPDKGWYAEYKDLLGKKLVHPYPGLWTIYHAIDEGIADPFQAYQSLRHIDLALPHIPVQAKGLPEKDLYLLSTTNWQPYTWSLNNVVLAENLHASLAYWQGNRPDEAFRLWKSALTESMYLGSSPGNIQQLSFYDAIRGELYRDFADPIGMAARSLTEGLFGIRPAALQDTLDIRPGFPAAWNYASLRTPDIDIDFKRTGKKDVYMIRQLAGRKLHLKLVVPMVSDNPASVLVNGRRVSPVINGSAVGMPLLQVNVPETDRYRIEITWQGQTMDTKPPERTVPGGGSFEMSFSGRVAEVSDPQQALHHYYFNDNKVKARTAGLAGYKTIFVKLEQGLAQWWQPVTLHLCRMSGLGSVRLIPEGFIDTVSIFEKVDMQYFFNDKVTGIFKQQYRSPRPVSPTLQLPVQGIGNWAYPLTMVNIDDNGVRKLAGAGNEIRSLINIPFATPSDSSLNNILFTSQWDNFPDSVILPLTGRASRLHLLMAGSTSAMQSRMVNGMVVVTYTDETSDTLLLTNPETWWPIEQDYYNDGFAFTIGDEMPERLYLKEGKFAKGWPAYTPIRGFTNRGIDGGAATVLDMGLDHAKTLRSLTVHAVANDVVIGLMAATLQR